MKNVSNILLFLRRQMDVKQRLQADAPQPFETASIPVSVKSTMIQHRWQSWASLPIAVGLMATLQTPVTAQSAGWGEWQPRDSVTERSFQTGLFNAEMGEFDEFEVACQTALGKPNEEIDYWVRFSDLIGMIGTGQVEYGCRQGDRFVYTFTATAVSTQVSQVDCLQVNTTSTGLNVRAWPGYSEQIVGGVANGATVDPGSFPASVVEVDGRNWVAIVAPVNGWVSNGSPGSNGNLSLCESTTAASKIPENPTVAPPMTEPAMP